LYLGEESLGLLTLFATVSSVLHYFGLTRTFSLSFLILISCSRKMTFEGLGGRLNYSPFLPFPGFFITQQHSFDTANIMSLVFLNKILRPSPTMDTRYVTAIDLT
jgi:hypothetical protein